VELGVAARVQTLRYGALLGIEEEEARRVFSEGRELAEAADDRRSLAMLLSNLGTVRGSQGATEEHLERSLEAVRLAEETGDPAVRLALRQPVAFCSALTGKLREALALSEEALELARGDPRLGARELGFSPYIWFVGFRGVLLNAMGRLEEGARELDRALELAREHDESETLVWTHGGYADLGFLTGESQMALGHCRRGVMIAERFGSPYWRAAAYTWLGHAHVLNEQWSEALEALQQALALARTRRTVLEVEARMLCHLAQAYLGAGRLEEARRAAAEAVSVAQQRRTRWYQCRAELTLGQVLARSEGVAARAEIEGALRRATALTVETGATAFEPFISLERAELARLAGDRVGQARDLREAERLFRAMGAAGQAERAAKQLVQLA
jgi:tetratricopeptide (TPR) repeat protein